MITIQTLQGTGVIRIESNPLNADIYLDGEFYGKSPITVKDVEMGLHTYTIKCKGYQDFSSSVNVVVGELCFVKYDFTNYGLEENCPPIQLSRLPETNITSNITSNITRMGVQSLQAPTPIPGYILISERSIIWALVGAVIAILVCDYFKKR